MFDTSVYGGETVYLIVFSVVIGIVVASTAAVYNNKMIGGIVRKLLKRRAFSPETAVNEHEFYKGFSLAKFHLRDGSYIRKIVNKCENGFYIPEDMRIRAELRYEKKKTPVMAIIIIAVLFIAAAIGFLYVYPIIMRNLQDLISELRG